MRHVQVPVIANEMCNDMYSKMEGDVTLLVSDDMMCAGFDYGGHDACQVKTIIKVYLLHVYLVSYTMTSHEQDLNRYVVVRLWWPDGLLRRGA